MIKQGSDKQLASSLEIIKEPQQPEMKQIFLLKSTPSCLDIIFMCPLPFFSVGCCISRTVKLHFNPNTEYVTYTGYYGLLCCFSTDKEIHYDQIKGVDVRHDPETHRCNERTFEVLLITKKQTLPITGNLVYKEALLAEKQLNEILIQQEILERKRNYN